MPTVIVTGASGLIGRHVVAELIGAGARIIAISRNGMMDGRKTWRDENSGSSARRVRCHSPGHGYFMCMDRAKMDGVWFHLLPAQCCPGSLLDAPQASSDGISCMLLTPELRLGNWLFPMLMDQ